MSSLDGRLVGSWLSVHHGCHRRRRGPDLVEFAEPRTAKLLNVDGRRPPMAATDHEASRNSRPS